MNLREETIIVSKGSTIAKMELLPEQQPDSTMASVCDGPSMFETNQTIVEEVMTKVEGLDSQEKKELSNLLMKYISSRGEVQPDPRKVEKVMSWPEPTTRKEVQQFLGLANYYRHFVQTLPPLPNLSIG